MICAEFEDRLTDYLDGALQGAALREFAEHSLRCPLCHELLNEVKATIASCRTAPVPPPAADLEARILIKTAPETVMSCEEFEELLTDYLDGFLAAPIYHRWERHAVLCPRCTNLPGQVVRAIGACYSYIKEERPVPAGLHEKILQATLGTTNAAQVRAPLPSRLAAWLREWLDGVVSPQLATVAMMFLVAVLVGTSTISEDGTVGGIYRASLRLAAQTRAHSASAVFPEELKHIAKDWANFMTGALSDRTPEGKSGQPQPDKEKK
jgi:anti-sigma factor RsiW